MPRQRREIQSELNQLIKSLGKALRKLVQQSQRELYERLEELFNLLDVENSLITQSSTNANLQSNISVQITASQSDLFARLLPLIIDGVRKIIGLNRDYYATRHLEANSVYEQSVNKVLLSLGFDNQTNSVIPESYLDNLAGSGVKRQILSRVSTAILARTSIGKFKNAFRKDFLGVGKLGLMEKEFSLLSTNLFSQVDRTASETIAVAVGLDHVIYSHTLKNNTRDFCRRRMNRIYTLSEVNKWDRLTWKGKIEGVPARVQQGGHNCRGSYRWITKELAERLAAQRGIEINSYN